ncbi:MAG: aromatic amino acid lyase [Deltaproteobacteria bacterium]|nr:MAG: aromatic amino acid lyase [Deltaproteobacteria bacterium]
MNALAIDGNSLSLADVAHVAAGGRAVLAESARPAMEASCDWVERAARGELLEAGEPMAVYGVNTGYGSLARVRIPPADAARLSWNLIRSHAAGVGEPCAIPVVRAMMLLRANALAKGASGCRPLLVETLLAMLDAGVHPVVPSQGSCGSSGDLAPLAHLALVVFRAPEGEPEASGLAEYQGKVMTGAEAMALAGIERLVPGPKDGLAMCNGAQLTTAFAALAAWESAQLVHDAEIVAAMSWEALRGVTRALHPAVHALRPYRGAVDCAADLRALLAGSTLVDSVPGKVQDAYSVRCTPQILGAVRDGVRFAAEQIGVELNSATDNPLILLDADDANKAFSAGLFHGEPVGMAADHLKLALTELAALAERRIYRLTTGHLSGRLPPALVHGDRPNMGLMVPQTTAAALVAECRSLCFPSTADSLPTCEDQEDHVAMSTTSARGAAEIAVNARSVLAIELLASANALWYRLDEPGSKLGVGPASALAAVESVLGGRGGEAPADDIAKLEVALRSGVFREAVRQAVGELTEVLGA